MTDHVRRRLPVVPLYRFSLTKLRRLSRIKLDRFALRSCSRESNREIPSKQKFIYVISRCSKFLRGFQFLLFILSLLLVLFFCSLNSRSLFFHSCSSVFVLLVDPLAAETVRDLLFSSISSVDWMVVCSLLVGLLDWMILRFGRYLVDGRQFIASETSTLDIITMIQFLDHKPWY
jgi:hypothetical protein